MLSKIIDFILILCALFAIVAGFIALNKSWEYFKIGFQIDTAKGLILLSTVALFSTGVLALSLYRLRQNK